MVARLLCLLDMNTAILVALLIVVLSSFRTSGSNPSASFLLAASQRTTTHSPHRHQWKRKDPAVSTGSCPIHSQLTNMPLRDTVTSMVENTGVIQVNNTQTQLVDLPGHPKLQYKITPHLQHSTKILFLVDATKMFASSRLVADSLYDLLTHPRFKPKTEVVIVCTHMDSATAIQPPKVKSMLEREMYSIYLLQRSCQTNKKR